MARKRPARTGNPDLRQQKQVPMPPIEEIEQKIYSLLSPLNFKPLKLYETEEKKPFRDRILTLSVMMALVVSLVYRQIPGLREVQRVLCEEGLLWAGRIEVSAQAVSKRLRTLPIELFAQIFEQVMERMNVQPQNQAVPENWQPVCAKFTAIWIADGSTLEALRRKLKVLQEQEKTLAGKIMMVVEAFSHHPVTTWYTQNSKANDKTWCEQLLERLPIGGLLIFDLGFFKFPWFDAFTEADKFFLTRLREKTSYKVIRCLTNASFYRNEIISMGEYRSNPCQHQVRLVSVLWGSTWYYYLTNVLDPQMLSAHLVCELGSRRWRVEDAFLLTKRLLGLAYIWVGDNNGVQIQIFATWIFYAVLNQLCIDIAIALNQPLDRISTEMVFRALYHFSQAVLRGDAHEAVPYLVERQKLFGLVKARRKRHREIDAYTQQIWAKSS
ncbi:IS4-like element ISNpu8 family transposase [Nostoc punctiforme]|uniref:Transposase, IS4 family protein n=1 Tax=Nostoc punctiforme (strain ATCC 29133 / PCC 73102) TaxID=63737 RepID=B2J2I5_NOSP7|nr:IS4-like element ISNpu8 family transposase [Nostoc punctiforme]ACC78877.1 transposase, IS4 family protein [Nostoc punctiforme PCC 73102]